MDSPVARCMSSQDPVSRKTTLQDSYTEMSEILMPNDTNNLGRALGGSVLHWMDICGAISARRFSNRQVVTAAMDHVDFMAPIDLGDVVTITGYVFDTGQTSMDIKVDVQAERPTQEKRIKRPPRSLASSPLTRAKLRQLSRRFNVQQKPRKNCAISQ